MEEGTTNTPKPKETNPIVYVLATLIFVAILFGVYLLGTKNPLNLSFGGSDDKMMKETAYPVYTPTPVPTVASLDTMMEEAQEGASASPKATTKPVATINPNIFFLPTPTPTIKPLQIQY